MKISLVVTTVKPPEYVAGLIASINDKGCPFDYEIIVVSPVEVKGQNVGWHHQPEEEATSSAAAFNYGASLATGDYIGGVADYFRFDQNWWEIVPAIERLSNNKYKLLSWYTGSVAGIRYPQIYCLSRDTMTDLMKGHLINPAYHYQFVPVDIGCRLVELGEPLGLWGQATTRIPYKIPQKFSDLKLKWTVIDRGVFLRRWSGMVPPNIIQSAEGDESIRQSVAMWASQEEIDEQIDKQTKLSLW